MTCSPLAISDVGNVIVCTSSTRPTGTQRYTGRTIFETDTGRLRTWNGSAWVGNGVVGYAALTTPVAGLTDTVTPLGMSVTFTASPERLYRIHGEVYYYADSAACIAGLVLKNGAGTQFQSSQVYLPAAAPTYSVKCPISTLATALSGSQTFAFHGGRTSGTGSGTITMSAGGGFPAWLIVEDVT